MELSFDNIQNSITKESILSKISELDIFHFYIEGFDAINKPFLSELRDEKSPSCHIYVSSENNLRYRDFGDDFGCDAFGYVMKKFNCTFYESLNIINCDFNIQKSGISINPNFLLANDEFKVKNDLNFVVEKPIISIVSKPFSLADYNYWNQYHIPLDKLVEFDVFSCSYVYLFKNKKRITFSYTNSNPIYAYRFTTDDCNYSYKIYFPLAKDKKHKWLFSGGASSDIEGYSNLPLFGDLLIITKSLKDVVVLNILGYNAISLQGEQNKLDFEFYNKLSKRFNRVVSLYDNDLSGLKGANYLYNTYGVNKMFVPIESGCKDTSDFIKKFGINKTRLMLEKELNKIL